MRPLELHSEWLPGTAKRADNFGQVCERARAWRWTVGQTIPRLLDAILAGTPTLNHAQRATLMLYARHLNQDRLEQDNACVWPSSSLIAAYLGCSERDARRHRKALEAAGYLVRDYNRANRPAGVEAFDLAPLMARLDEMEDAEAAVREAQQFRRASYLAALIHQQELTAHPDKAVRLEQSQKNLVLSVTQSDAPTARTRHSQQRPTVAGRLNVKGTSTKTEHETNRSTISSSEGASGFGKGRSERIELGEIVRLEVLSALKACPRLAAILPEHLCNDPMAATGEDAGAIAQAAQHLLPNPDRNNDKTALWGWRRHGPRIIAMLAIALEDQKVRSPCGYFGKLATSEPGAALDLRLNLSRIIRDQSIKESEKTGSDVDQPTEKCESREPPAVMDAPGIGDPLWLAIDAELRRTVRQGPYGAWFGRIGFHGASDGILSLSAPNRLAAEKLQGQFASEIRAAAEAAGCLTKRIVVVVRGDPACGK